MGMGEEDKVLGLLKTKASSMPRRQMFAMEPVEAEEAVEMDDVHDQVQTQIAMPVELVIETDAEKKKLQEVRRELKKFTNRAKKNTAMCKLGKETSLCGWKPRECADFGCMMAHVQCTKRNCNFAHCERALSEGRQQELDLTKTVDCKFGDKCADPANCRFVHPGEAKRVVQVA